MRTLYLDLFSGISGDMFIGALIDVGVEFSALERGVRQLNLDGYHLHSARRTKAQIEGIKFDVHLSNTPCPEAPASTAIQFRSPTKGSRPGSSPASATSPASPSEIAPVREKAATAKQLPPHRDFATIAGLIAASALSPWVKERATSVFRRLAVAEGKIHGISPDRVHFHEVGAVDSIVDIVGVCLGLELLGRPRVLASAVVEGTGWVRCEHGRFPVPTPATLELLRARQIPLTQCEEPSELVTPTGAALLAEFAESFGPMTGLVATRIGYGLGTRDNRTRPNVLRAVLCEDSAAASSEAGGHDWETDTVVVLETNLDDIRAEILGHVLDKALRQGALDAFHTPVQMKKNRPGVLLTVLCEPADADALTELLLTETSAFGVRRRLAERRKLQRESIEVATPNGRVTVKLGRLDGRVVQIAPEYESCRSVAAQAGVAVKQVYDEALFAAQTQINRMVSG